ncbi:histidine phosphatase family protein [Robbsia sp. KACC 23696]|uniref:histidine phosphatase family protein n=1 Tax=Robbsia sp. KACC 23696 TaxID=3149231 RepID=UPI00325B8385
MDLVLIRHPPVDVPSGVCYGQTDLALRRDVGTQVTDLAAEADRRAPSIAAPGMDSLTRTVASIKQHFQQRGPVLACFASPLRRCADVAHALTGADTNTGTGTGSGAVTDTGTATRSEARPAEHARFPAAPVIDPRLSEIDFGQWEMQRWDDIPRDQIDRWAADVLHERPHHGESAHMLAERCGSWLHDLSLQFDSQTAAAPACDDDTTRACVVVIGHAGPIRLLTALALGMPLMATLQWPLDFGGIVTLRRDRRSHAFASATEASAAHAASAARRTPGARLSAAWTLRQWNG